MKKVIFTCIVTLLSIGVFAQTDAYGVKISLPAGWKVVDNSQQSWSFISARHPQKNASIQIESFTGNNDEISLKINSFFKAQAKLAYVSPEKLGDDYIDENMKVVKKPEKGLNFFVLEMNGDATNENGEKGWTLVYVTKMGNKIILFGAVERYKGKPEFQNVIRNAFESISK